MRKTGVGRPFPEEIFIKTLEAMLDASYVTTPIYYVNGPPHLGHAYTSRVADILKRARKMAGFRSFLSTGVDEHGQKNEQMALESGMSFKEYLDMRALQFRDLFDLLDVDYDFFARTTAPTHVRAVVYLEERLYERGLLVKQEYEGLYCSGCEQFKKESDLSSEGFCLEHPNILAERTVETNYFFKMEPFRKKLQEHITANPHWISPTSYRNEVIAMLENPLEDLCISRPKSRVSLGIELPFDDDYVTYVWFDALLNYLSNIGWPDESYEGLWLGSEHVIGKDILKTHCVYWPCM